MDTRIITCDKCRKFNITDMAIAPPKFCMHCGKKLKPKKQQMDDQLEVLFQARKYVDEEGNACMFIPMPKF